MSEPVTVIGPYPAWRLALRIVAILLLLLAIFKAGPYHETYPLWAGVAFIASTIL